MSRMFEDAMESRADQALAEALGLTMDEIAESDCTVDPIHTEDDLLVGYLVRFGDECPASIRERVKGLSDDKTVMLDPSVFEEEEEPYD